MNPQVEWIDGGPPPDGRAHSVKTAHTTLLIGQLMTRPGRWAVVMRGERIGSASRTFKKYGCEAVERRVDGVPTTFARYIGSNGNGAA